MLRAAASSLHVNFKKQKVAPLRVTADVSGLGVEIEKRQDTPADARHAGAASYARSSNRTGSVLRGFALHSVTACARYY